MHFLIKRAITYFAVFMAVLQIVFFLPRAAPGNAAEILASNTRFPAVAVQIITQRFGLDQPLYTQYVDFLKNVFLTFPPYFGLSYGYYPATVSSLFAVRVGWSFLLILTSLAVGELLTLLIGILVARRRGGKLEIGTLYGSITFISVPLFWFAMVLLYIFAITTHYFPLFGNVSLTVAPYTWPWYQSVIWHMILPVVTLSLSLMCESFLILRGSMQDVLKADYVLTAKSRGLSGWSLSYTYILRNSLLPLVSVVSFSTASMLSRLILIEAVFGYPGIGDLIVDAVLGRDYPVIVGSMFYLVLVVIAGGLIGDVILVRMDPRLRR